MAPGFPCTQLFSNSEFNPLQAVSNAPLRLKTEVAAAPNSEGACKLGNPSNSFFRLDSYHVFGGGGGEGHGRRRGSGRRTAESVQRTPSVSRETTGAPRH